MLWVLALVITVQALDDCARPSEVRYIEESISATANGLSCHSCVDSVVELTNPLCLTEEQLRLSSCVYRTHSLLHDQALYLLLHNDVFDSLQFDNSAGIAYLIAAEGRIPRQQPCDRHTQVIQKLRWYIPSADAPLSSGIICDAIANGCKEASILPNTLRRNFTDNICNVNAHIDNRCNVSVSDVDGNQTVTARCVCAEDYTGSRCQFKKTDYCCGTGNTHQRCDFEFVATRLATANTRSSWCGGLDVDCISQNGLDAPICLCNESPNPISYAGYLGHFCTSSKCDELPSGVSAQSLVMEGSCNERSLETAPGYCTSRCSATQAGSTSCLNRNDTSPIFYCQCANKWPVYNLPDTGCRAIATGTQIAACGITEILTPTRGWSSECGDMGHCESNGCVCHHTDGIPAAQCSASLCVSCNTTNSDCSPAVGICNCYDIFDGPTCDNNRCADTGGIVRGDVCQCPRYSTWHFATPSQRAGCILDIPSANGTVCGLAVTYGRSTRLYATGTESVDIANYISQCRCALASRRDRPVTQDTNTASPLFGICSEFCPPEHSYRSAEGRCCWDHNSVICTCAPGYNTGGQQQDPRCQTLSCQDGQLFNNGVCVCDSVSTDDPQLFGGICPL